VERYRASDELRLRFTVIPDGFSGAALTRLLRQSHFLGRLWLAMDNGVSALIEAFEKVGRRVWAKTAVDARVIHIIQSRNVFRGLLISICHNVILPFAAEIWRKPVVD
jgi:hypothetical protein